MNPQMGLTDWFFTLLLGGMLGVIGQGIRVVIGLKKLNQEASLEGKPFSELFQGSALSISLLIGFVAGALAIIGITDGNEATKPSKELIVTILGAGYAGTDFIEGFINKYLPKGRRESREGTVVENGEQPAVG